MTKERELCDRCLKPSRLGHRSIWKSTVASAAARVALDPQRVRSPRLGTWTPPGCEIDPDLMGRTLARASTLVLRPRHPSRTVPREDKSRPTLALVNLRVTLCWSEIPILSRNPWIVDADKGLMCYIGAEPEKNRGFLRILGSLVQDHSLRRSLLPMDPYP